MKKYIFYLGILAFIGASYGFYQYHKPHQNMVSSKADFQMKAIDLFANYEKDEKAADSKYLDKIIEVSGRVKEVSNDSETITITLETGDEMAGILCQLDQLAEQKRTTFKIGESVSFKGVCTGMLMDIVLVRCVEAP